MSDTAGWGARVVELEAEVKQLRADRLGFSSALGFGDGFSEPAATLEQMLEPIEDAFQSAHDHDECPRFCELCGERLAATRCDRCHGGGCIPNASWTYEECPPCGGAGWVHDGCAGFTYDELAAEVTRLRAELDESVASVFEKYC